MFGQMNWSLWLDIALLALPVLLVLFFILKFVVPKKPLLGIGLAIGTGLFGAWLVRRRLQGAQDAEAELAAHNKMMAEFRDKQDKRAKSVLANKKIIETLQEQRQKLAKDAQKYETELKVLDAELQDRKKMNEVLLDDSNRFLSASEKRSVSRKKLLAGFDQPATDVVNTGTVDDPQIDINGYRLIRVE